MLTFKDEKVKSLLECFDTMQNKLIPNSVVKEVAKPIAVQGGGRTREDSYKTLRELPLFGEISHAVDFKHPSIEDL